MAEIDESLLPGLLREMTELIGLSATMAIVQEYGGVRLYVPINVPPTHCLIKLVGIQNAEKLAARYGGLEHFDIPKAEAALRHLRNEEIKQQWPDLSQRELALKYGLTERTVRDIVSSEPQNVTQLGLFEMRAENE